MKKTNKRNRVIIVLIVLLLALAIGYAALSATLTINGTATGTGTWDVRFLSTRFVQADGTTTDTTHGGSAVISTNQTTNDTITASVNLAYPGDGVLLEAVVKNNGSIPAILSDFQITGTDTDFEVVQAAGGPTANETLAGGATCTAQFLVRWKPGSTATSLGTKTFTITYDYDQNTTAFSGTASHSDS